ncbi:thymidylate kinase [Burkholderiales bacterium GJ-E10]|nr:thymidylate kinase [Burkholderiales bacterium GJ-E10]
MGMRGKFLTFEGVDGAGKTTQCDALAQALTARGVSFVRTREPGGTPLGEELRGLLLHRAMEPLTEALLMFAARREHIVAVIEPALARGQWVLCDRFTDASYAYQGGGRGLDAAHLDTLAQWVQGTLQPDLTVLADVAPELAQARRTRVREADRFEAEALEFFLRVRAAYHARAHAEPERFFVIDGARPPEDVTAEILQRLEPWLQSWLASRQDPPR